MPLSRLAIQHGRPLHAHSLLGRRSGARSFQYPRALVSRLRTGWTDLGLYDGKSARQRGAPHSAAEGFACARDTALGRKPIVPLRYRSCGDWADGSGARRLCAWALVVESPSEGKDQALCAVADWFRHDSTPALETGLRTPWRRRFYRDHVRASEYQVREHPRQIVRPSGRRGRTDDLHAPRCRNNAGDSDFLLASLAWLHQAVLHGAWADIPRR